MHLVPLMFSVTDLRYAISTSPVFQHELRTPELYKNVEIGATRITSQRTSR